MAEWVHVAVVNDPADGTVTMYVDGTPILRNVLYVTGIQHDDAKPWILGAGQWGETLTEGWNDCIGETRLVTEPLEEDQWLTARAEAEAPVPSAESTEEPTTEPSEDPTQEPTSIPTEEPTDLETDPTTEPTESPSADTVASDIDSNNDDLARTGAGVLWLLAAGFGAIVLGAVTMLVRRRDASQS